jgi:hypothetical protein
MFRLTQRTFQKSLRAKRSNPMRSIARMIRWADQIASSPRSDSAESFDPESFGPESFGPELTTEGLTTEGLVAGSQ